MTTKSLQDILGMEWDWLACDAVGHVALLSTAGGGYAPPEFLRDTDAYDAALDEILASPTTTEALFAPQLAPHLKNTWRMAAERGLFAFDSDVHGSPYRLVAAPREAVLVGRMPVTVAGVARRVTLHRLQFAKLRTIPKESLLEERGSLGA